MRFMNDYDISRALDDYADHPVLGPASQTLANLAEWTDRNSDGWAYWPKPTRAASKLIELITGDGTWQAQQDLSRATPAAYAAALRPVKAFRTRQHAAFEIVTA